jgi:4-aminobutyrate aminotransferase-like enzyme
MSLQERSDLERVQKEGERYVPRGISAPPLLVSRARGVLNWDADGRVYLESSLGDSG